MKVATPAQYWSISVQHHKPFMIGGMKKVLCLLLLVGGGFLLADDPSTTFGLQNGRFWNAMSTDSRPYFLVGMFEGWHARQLRDDFITVKEAKAFYGEFRTMDVAKMVTSVYGEPENLELPIAWVTMACFAVQRGDTTRDAVFMALRKHLSNELKRTDAHPFNEVDPIDIILNSRPK